MMFHGFARGMDITGRDGIANGMMFTQHLLHSPENRHGHAAGAVNLHFHRLEMLPNAGIASNFRDCFVESVIGFMKWTGFVLAA
ncbi:hypothetical protein DK52_3002 [Brucella abortus]|nr:hypothetical protein DK52_3002 [Brucella abortus]